MALTNTNTTKDTAPGPLRVTKISSVPDSSYPTGGEALDIQAIVGERDTILAVIPGRAYTTSTGAALGVRAIWDGTAEKLMLFDAAGAEEGNGDNQSAITYETIVIHY